ncbi:MAG: YggT family protein [Candidatus Gastranaerophilales bacterium]|nr:YggT family protein [Candidatus Gastranaerophilales bacterium]
MISNISLIKGIDLFFQIIIWIMIVRILLTWFPNINWYNQPFKAMKDITDPILEPFRRIIPPFGGIDFSPIVAFAVISFAREIVIRLLIML